MHKLYEVMHSTPPSKLYASKTQKEHFFFHFLNVFMFSPHSYFINDQLPFFCIFSIFFNVNTNEKKRGRGGGDLGKILIGGVHLKFLPQSLVTFWWQIFPTFFDLPKTFSKPAAGSNHCAAEGLNHWGGGDWGTTPQNPFPRKKK